MDECRNVIPEVKATVFRPFTACVMEYTSLPQLVYDLENRKDVFKSWFVLMNGTTYTVDEFIDWYIKTHLNFTGAKFYEKV